MSAWIKEKTFSQRNEFRKYIDGLIRHEIHKGDDNPHRLEVLSKIYYDLLYTEDLRDAKDWKKGKVGDNLTTALDQIVKMKSEMDGSKEHLHELLDFITNDKTKKDIIEYVEEIKKKVN